MSTDDIGEAVFGIVPEPRPDMTLSGASTEAVTSCPEMVQRVARAMCLDMGIPPDNWDEEDGVRVYAWQKEASAARAALAAMREPTEGMIEAYCRAHERLGFHAWANASYVLPEVIDAALA